MLWRLHSYTHHAPVSGLCLPATLIPGQPSPLAATLGPQSACILPAQPTKGETDFYVMLCPVYLFWTCCCFERSALGLTVPSCCLSYCTELVMALARRKPEPMQHLRLVRFSHTYLLQRVTYAPWLVPARVSVHGQRDRSAPVLKPSRAGFCRKAGRGGKTLALKWVFCGVLFVESELSWALLLCGCHGEKHRLLCNKIIQEKTFPRIFQSQETDGKLQNSWGAAVHHPPLSALHFRALIFVLWELPGSSPLT